MKPLIKGLVGLFLFTSCSLWAVEQNQYDVLQNMAAPHSQEIQPTPAQAEYEPISQEALKFVTDANTVKAGALSQYEGASVTGPSSSTWLFLTIVFFVLIGLVRQNSMHR